MMNFLNSPAATYLAVGVLLLLVIILVTEKLDQAGMTWGKFLASLWYFRRQLPWTIWEFLSARWEEFLEGLGVDPVEDEQQEEDRGE